MAADLRLVMNPSQADAHELSAERARNGFAERRLADAGRTDETQDRSTRFLLQFPHGEMFENALFDLFETIMVLIEDLLRSV